MPSKAISVTPSNRLTASRRYPLIIVGLAVLSHGGFALSGQGFTPFYPFIQDDLSLSNAQIGLLIATIFAAATMTSSGLGWAIDRFGVRSTAGGGMIASGMVVSTLYFTNSFLLLLVIAAVMGALRPIGHPAGTKAIMDWVGPGRRGTAMSFKQAGNPVLAALAAVAVPPIAVTWGWQAAALALGGFILVGGVVILALYRDRPGLPATKEKQRPFFKGMVRVMRDRNITLAVAGGFPLVGAQVTTLAYFILFLNDQLGLSVILAGGMLAILQVSNIVMRIGWGVISDTLGKGRRKPVLIISVLGTAATVLILALLPSGTPMWALVLVSIALGATVTSWVSVHGILVAELSEPGQIGITFGYASTASRMGIVITPPVFGFIADNASYQTAWLALVGFILVGLVFLSLVRDPAGR